MAAIETLGEERILVAEHGHDGSGSRSPTPLRAIATVRIDELQAAELAEALARDREAA